MPRRNIIKEKSLGFAVRIVKLCWYLTEEKGERVMSKQLLRCGTSIGANVWEAEHAQSNADYISKNNIALKEANETEYWLMLLWKTDYLSAQQYESINDDCQELNKMLITAVKTLKAKTDHK